MARGVCSNKQTISIAKTMQTLPGLCLVLLRLHCICASNVGDVYVVDDSVSLGRRFDGVGAISGGGVSNFIEKLWAIIQVNTRMSYD